MTLKMYDAPPNPRAYDHGVYLSKLTRLCRKCKKSGTRRAMHIGNLKQALIKLKEPKNGFAYKYWPYFECKCGYQEAL